MAPSATSILHEPLAIRTTRVSHTHWVFARDCSLGIQALPELARDGYPGEARSAAETLRQALEDSIALGLPMVVDW